MQCEFINKKDVETKLFWKFGKFTSRDGKHLYHITRGFVDEWDGQERIDCLYNSSECAISTTPSTRIVKNEVNDLRAKRLANITNHIALVATTQVQSTYYPQVQHTYHNQAPLSLSSPRQTTTTRSPSASHAATRRQGKEIVIAPSPPSESNHKDINDEEEIQRDKDMQKAVTLLFKTFRQIGQNENQRAFLVDGNKETIGQVVQQTRVKCYNYNGLGIWPRSVEQLKGLKIIHIIKKRCCSVKRRKQGKLSAEEHDWVIDSDGETED
ncbi:hypothetical protein Tco_0547654 [Tanacetum coccineum]